MIFTSLLQHLCATMTFVNESHISARCREDEHEGSYTLLAWYYLIGNETLMALCALLSGCTTVLTVIWSGSVGESLVPSVFPLVIHGSSVQVIGGTLLQCLLCPSTFVCISIAMSIARMYHSVWCWPFIPCNTDLSDDLQADSLSLSVRMQLF